MYLEERREGVKDPSRGTESGRPKEGSGVAQACCTVLWALQLRVFLSPSAAGLRRSRRAGVCGAFVLVNTAERHGS